MAPPLGLTTDVLSNSRATRGSTVSVPRSPVWCGACAPNAGLAPSSGRAAPSASRRRANGMVRMLLIRPSMNIAKWSLLPDLGLAVAHRTTREWRLGGSAHRDGEGMPTSLGRVMGVAAGLALGVGLTFLLTPEARATARRLLKEALSGERAPSGLRRHGEESSNATTSQGHRVNATSRDSEDADVCDAS
jgi:hypothetical protein